MKVFELLRPGRFLVWPAETKEDAMALLRLLEGALAEAAVALHLFEQQLIAEETAPRLFTGEQWWEIRRDLTASSDEERLQEMLASPCIDTTEAASDQRQIRGKRKAWATLAPPSEYTLLPKFIHARSFVHALNDVAKGLRVLAKLDGAPSSLDEPLQMLRDGLPDIVDVRNSVEHSEDRVRGKARTKTIKPLAIADGFFSAPEGVLFVRTSLEGRFYTATAADGRLKRVPISEESVTVAQGAIQGAIDRLKWMGPFHHSPDWPSNG